MAIVGFFLPYPAWPYMINVLFSVYLTLNTTAVMVLPGANLRSGIDELMGPFSAIAPKMGLVVN